MNEHANVDGWNGDGPLPELYSRTATGAVNVWQCWVEGDEVCVGGGQMEGAFQYARFKCKPKNEGGRNQAHQAHARGPLRRPQAQARLPCDCAAQVRWGALPRVSKGGRHHHAAVTRW